MLSLPDPDDYGFSEPTGHAAPRSLAAPPVRPSCNRPSLDHDGVRIPSPGLDDAPSAYMPRDVLSNLDVIKCAK